MINVLATLFLLSIGTSSDVAPNATAAAIGESTLVPTSAESAGSLIGAGTRITGRRDRRGAVPVGPGAGSGSGG